MKARKRECHLLRVGEQKKKKGKMAVLRKRENRTEGIEEKKIEKKKRGKRTVVVCVAGRKKDHWREC